MDEEIKMSNEIFGLNRFNPDDPEVLRNKSLYETNECDVCGRQFAVKIFSKKYRSCCGACSKIWDEISRRRDQGLLRLYYWRVKVPRELNGVDIGDIYYTEFTTTDMDILLSLKSRVGMTSIDLVESIYGKIESTNAGFIKRRSTIVSRCEVLIRNGLIRKYKGTKKGVGRKPTRYKLNNEIVTLNKPCPNCNNNNYILLKKSKKIKCIGCNLEWKIPGVEYD